MGAGPCAKIILCAHGGADELSQGNTLINYRSAEGAPIGDYDTALDDIKGHLKAVYTTLSVVLKRPYGPLLDDRESIAASVRNVCTIVIHNDESFTDSQFLSVISHLDAIEEIAGIRSQTLLKRCGWPLKSSGNSSQEGDT